MTRRLALLVLPLVALGACGGQPTASAPIPVPTATVTATVYATPEPTKTPDSEVAADPAPNTRVKSLKGVYELFQTAGVTCDVYTVTVKTFASDCDDGQVLLNDNPGGKAETRFYQSALDLGWSAIQDQKRSDIAILIGPNWFVRISTKDAKTLRDDYHLGDTILGC